jgi:hypothetical protein
MKPTSTIFFPLPVNARTSPIALFVASSYHSRETPDNALTLPDNGLNAIFRRMLASNEISPKAV